MKPLTAFLFFLALLWPAHGMPDVLPVIDAHSQFDDNVPMAQVIEYSTRAGVTQVLLSARGRVTTAQVLDLGAKHPACIVPSVRTKGRGYDENLPTYYTQLGEQLSEPGFRAMSEVILVHAPKGKRAPEVNVLADAPQVKEVIRRGIEKGWPIVLHYEFRWLGRAHGASARATRMAELRSLLSQHPQHPFALIHMAQLDADDAAELLAAHPNLVFLTSHANTLAVDESKQPWTNMFAGGDLTADWKTLLLKHPDRFVLALDNVWPEHWAERYVRQVELWRGALSKLPDEVAHAVAHRNAERLWKLAPAVLGQGCGALKLPMKP